MSYLLKDMEKHVTSQRQTVIAGDSNVTYTRSKAILCSQYAKVIYLSYIQKLALLILCYSIVYRLCCCNCLLLSLLLLFYCCYLI